MSLLCSFCHHVVVYMHFPQTYCKEANWLMGVVLKLTLHSNHSVHSCLVTKGIFKLQIHLSTVGGCNAAPWFHFLIRVNSERKLVVMMVWTGC